MFYDYNHRLLIDINGNFICSDSKDIFEIILKYGNNIFDIIQLEYKEELNNLWAGVKNGQTIEWHDQKPLFSAGIEYIPDRFSPVYGQNLEVIFIELLIIQKVKEKDKRIGLNDNKFEILFNNAKDAIFVTDLDGNYIEVNQSALERTGFTKEQFLSLNINNTPIKNQDQTFINYFQEIMLFGESTTFINYKNGKGNIIETEISGKHLIFNGLDAILHISREISQRNKKQAENIESLIHFEEKERSDFAHQINDVIGPNLSIIKMFIESLVETSSEKKKIEITSKIKEIIDSSIMNITKISNKISPHILDNLGLRLALESFIKNLKESFSINFSYIYEISDKLQEKISIVIYRVVTELLNNLTSHKEIKNIIVKIYTKKNLYIFEIIDDGFHLSVGEILNLRKSKQLVNIINKVESHRGELFIESSQAKGNKIKIEIPKDEKQGS